MGEVKGIGEVIAQVCHEEGVEHMFGLPGFHAEYSVTTAKKLFGTKMHLMRHEAHAVYAMDGYCGASRKPSVTWLTAGPGVTNGMSGVAQLMTNQRPAVVFCGKHGPLVDDHWALQEAQPLDLMKPVTKAAIEIRDKKTFPYDVRRAFRIAKAAPQGPVAVVTNPSLARPTDMETLSWWIERDQCARVTVSGGDPVEVEKIVDRIMKAERPLIIAGDGSYFSHAEAEMKDFAELLQIPVCGRRTAAGIIPETAPLAVGAGWRARVMADADLIMLIGMREGTTEGMMYAPGVGIYRRDINYIQINESHTEVVEFLPTSSMLIANPKLALRQIIECAKERLGTKKVERTAWIKTINKHRASLWESVAQAAAKDKTSPIGGHIFGKEFSSFVNGLGKYILVQDSFTGAAASSTKCLALEPGTALDAGGWSGVGHGLPMAYGAKIARPDIPAIALMGDLGMFCIMEYETFTRENVPVVGVLFNNSEFIGGGHEYIYGAGGNLCGNQVTKDYRYDLMFERLGVHGEFVTEPQQIRPALERAVNSGKPALVNVIVDPYFFHPWLSLIGGAFMSWFGVERCRELGLYQDAYWTDFVIQNKGGEACLEQGGTKEEAMKAAIEYQLALYDAVGDQFGL